MQCVGTPPLLVPLLLQTLWVQLTSEKVHKSLVERWWGQAFQASSEDTEPVSETRADEDLR